MLVQLQAKLGPTSSVGRLMAFEKARKSGFLKCCDLNDVRPGKKIGAYEYLYLVENAREGGRHVQRVVKALGRRNEEASEMLDALVASGGAALAALDRAIKLLWRRACRVAAGEHRP
jgi:hypothetical protein